jgi:hypothetical protein
MDIYVPATTALVITSSRGDVTLTGMNGNVESQSPPRGSQHQRPDRERLAESGRQFIAAGACERRRHDSGKANEVAVEDVDGEVHLNGDFQESVRLVRVSKTVSFHSARTDMEFSRLDGRLDLDSGDLRADSLTGTDAPDDAVEGCGAGRFVGRSAP